MLEIMPWVMCINNQQLVSNGVAELPLPCPLAQLTVNARIYDHDPFWPDESRHSARTEKDLAYVWQLSAAHAPPTELDHFETCTTCDVVLCNPPLQSLTAARTPYFQELPRPDLQS